MTHPLQPLPQGTLLIPCRDDRPVLTVKPASFSEVQVPTLCGHPAWAHELLTTANGRIALRITHANRIVRSNILTRITPYLFPPPPVRNPVQCTRCDLAEKLEGSTVCGWCQKIIFPEDAVAATFDDSRVVDMRAHRTICSWDKRIVVCRRETCARRVRMQIAEHGWDHIAIGTWHHRYAIIVPLPR